jgi:Domain of unknown function (DUF4349)
MRLHERELPLDPEIERELEAIDQGLAGQRVDPDLEELALLAVEVRGERPEPSAEAEALLDELAANGFPPRRSDRLGRASRRLGDPFAGLRRKGARRLVPAFSAAAVLVIAAAVGISESGVFGGGESTGGPSEVNAGTPSAVQSSGGAPEAPFVRARKAQARPDATAIGGRLRTGSVVNSSSGAADTLGSLTPGSRKVAQSVDLELSTAPDDFRNAADGVLDVVRAHRGFVVNSDVSGGDPDVRGAKRGHASFELRIPAGELSGAMGDLSDLGHVVSRTDGTLDITKRFVSARKRIDALTVARSRLLRQLGEAVTIAEQQSIRARLRIIQARLAAAHQDLARAQQRVHMVPVSVRITADARASSGGAWTIGDAFHDAGRVLTVTVGAALVGGAALLPFALLAALAAAGWRGWVRRQRSRALDAPTG